MKELRRRDFLRYSGLGLATIVIGGCGGGGVEVVETLNFTITDAIKEMITHEPNGLGRASVGPDVTNATAAQINFQITNNFSMSDINLTQQEIAAIAAALAFLAGP